MKREIKEETGINIKIWGYLPHVDHILKKEHQHWIALNYLANLKSGAIKNMETEKCNAIRWFSLKRLPRKLTKTTREPIKNFLKKKYIRLK